MIEVRLCHRDMVEYSTIDGLQAYICGNLAAAGVPVCNGMITQEGYLVVTEDNLTMTNLYQWLSASEMFSNGALQ